MSLTRIGELDMLIQEAEIERGLDRLAARGRTAHAQGTLPSSIKKQNTSDSLAQIVRNYRAQVKRRVDALPAAQVARETRMHGFDEAVAMDKTRIEMMQMERSLGYPLHIPPDDVPNIALAAFYWEKTGRMSRADSVHVSLLQQKMQQRKRLDDADIESLSAILRAPSKTSPSIPHGEVMDLFSRLPNASLAQQQKIREAVTPFLTSRDRWERDLAAKVLQNLGGIAPPGSAI